MATTLRRLITVLQHFFCVTDFKAMYLQKLHKIIRTNSQYLCSITIKRLVSALLQWQVTSLQKLTSAPYAEFWVRGLLPHRLCTFLFCKRFCRAKKALVTFVCKYTTLNFILRFSKHIDQFSYICIIKY